jgi:hypothetical protein
LGFDIFGTGITSADFQSVGMRPCAILALKMEHIGPADFFYINFIDIFASNAKAYQGGSHYLQNVFLYKKKQCHKNTNTKKNTINNKEGDRHRNN